MPYPVPQLRKGLGVGEANLKIVFHETVFREALLPRISIVFLFVELRLGGRQTCVQEF